MKAKFILLTCTAFLLLQFHINAQTNTFPSTGSAGIGTTTPDVSSLLEIKSTKKGLLIPRMTKAQRDAIATPATGLMIYQTNASPGFYYYNGDKWGAVAKGANASLSNLAAATAINTDLLPDSNNLRNLGSASLSYKNVNFYNLKFADGTTQTTAATPSQWTTNGANIYYNTGNVGIGTTTPASKLSIQSGSGYLFQLTTGIVDIRSYQNSSIGQIGTYSNHPFQLMANNGINQFVLLPNGNVGIDTANPAALLDVNGDVLIHRMTLGYGVDTSNTILGRSALPHQSFSTDISANTAIGNNTLFANTTGRVNTAIGYGSLYSNTTGYNNSAIGSNSLFNNTTGFYNTACGQAALSSNTTGHSNTGIGFSSLFYNTSGAYNTASGWNALFINSTGYDNTAYGGNALYGNTTGFVNTAVGFNALNENETGSYNTACGQAALYNNLSGSNNTALGYNAGVSTGALTNATVIGYNATVNASNKVQVGNSSVTVIGGQVGWSTFSDGRFKKDIQQNVPGLLFINKLKPVTYHVELEKYEQFLGRKDSMLNVIKPQLQKASQKLRTGFIAQEVEQAAKEMNYDFDGVNHPQNDKDNYSLVYADFVPSLVKAVQELSKMNDAKDASIDSLKTANQQLSARLDKIEAMLSQQNINSSNTSSINQQTVELGSNALLYQNFPNPFTNSTTINYYLPVNNNNAFINFYNETGTLLKSVKLSGNGKGSINIKANELAAGTYRYALIVDGKIVDTKQMISSK